MHGMFAVMRYGWSPCPGVWGLLEKTLSNVAKKFEWQHVNLNPNNDMAIPDGLSGVYMLCLAPPKCSKHFTTGENASCFMFNALYIGSSTNLRQRFTDYANKNPRNTSSKSMKKFLDDYYGCPIVFVYTACASPDCEIEAIEDVLVRAFGPSINGKYVKKIPAILAKISKHGKPI